MYKFCPLCVEHLDFREIFKKYDTADTFFYLNPPYIPNAHKSGKYKHDMTCNDHDDLADILNNMKGKFLLSGYDNELYNSQGWQKASFNNIHCSSIGCTDKSDTKGKGSHMLKKYKRTECVWTNFALEGIQGELL